MIVRKRNKYEHGGAHPTREEKRQQMLSTGRFTEGPNGELIRVPQEDMFGFPTTERARQLSESTEPLNEQQLSEYIRYGFSPTNPVNTAFSMVAGATPAGAAVDVVGNVIGKGLGYVARGGRQLMNFLRPASDEVADAVQLGMKSDPMRYGDARFTADQILDMEKGKFTNELKQIDDFIVRRKNEIMSPEGQRRLTRQMEADVEYMRQLSRLDNKTLERMGFDATARIHMKNTLRRIDKDPGAYYTALRSSYNNRVGRIKNTTEARVFDELAALERQLASLQKAADDAFDAGNTANFQKLQAQIQKKGQQWQDKSQQVRDEMYNAFYAPETGEITLGKASLLHPDLVQGGAAHEFQHGLLSDQAFQKSFFDDRARLGQGVFQTGIPRTTEADRILHDELKLLSFDDIDKMSLPDRDKVELFTGVDYMKTPAFRRHPVLGVAPTGRGGTGSEMTPHLAELREQLVAEGVMKDRYSPVTSSDIQKYITNYRRRDPNFNQGAYTPQMEEDATRIIEYLDPKEDAANSLAIAKALNKMLVAVPAVGAAGVAAGTTADDGSSYYKGGKLKLKKEKQYGMRVV
tara:strand:- start:17791 stop:19521 length:1731 start_codon:yes stop_codon:yes gene_type:complete